MSDEQFLVRWSRRKQEANAGHAESGLEEAAEANESAPSDRAAAEPVPSETDLSNLPPIESIDAATDITAFLRKGIPQELSRAALRRAWTADPAIRDYMGPAENAWDFNDPNAMPGFGPLDYSTEQIEALVRRVVEGVVRAAESRAKPQVEVAEGVAQPDRAEAGFVNAPNPDATPRSSDSSAELSSSSVASQPPGMRDENLLQRHTHGGALPQ